MSRLHTLTIELVGARGVVRARVRVDVSQRRTKWWRAFVDELAPGMTLRVSGDSCELVDARPDGAT